MTRDEERAIIAKGRDLWSDASAGVTERMKGGEHFLEGRIIPEAAPSPILIFHPEADYRDIAFYTNVHRLVEALFLQRDRLVEFYNRHTTPAQQAAAEPEKKPFSYAQNCAIYCSKRWFQRYMLEVHNLDHPSDMTRMATRIRSLLAIESRTQLDTDEAARDRWLSLRAHARAWKDGKI